MANLTILILILLLPLHAFSEDQGKELYNAWCSQCHGVEGDAESYAKDFTFPKPRDFSFGLYKFRTTPTGAPPTDEDLIRTIRKGNPGTTMPAWERFSDSEVRSLVNYIKKFAPDIFTGKPETITVGKPPSCNAETIAKGKEVFKEAKCWECHGDNGRGNGEKAWEEDFLDDWGDRIYPADLTHPWELKNGSEVEDIFRTVTTGLNGTPMTSYQDALSDDERWSLACFVTSLQTERRLGSTLRVMRVDAIPASPDDKLWETVDYLDIPMAGQIGFEPRYFIPTIRNVRVRGVYTHTEVAVMVEWTDKRPNGGDDGLPPDGAYLQFPARIPEGVEKPYFYRGDKKRKVNLWQWKASDTTGIELNAMGPESVTRQERQDVKVSTTYGDGLYRVLFSRALDTKDTEDILFEIGKFIPFTITLYDGRNHEEGNKGVISAWYYIMLEPPMPLKVYIVPPVVSFIVFGVGMGLHKRLKRK